DLGWSGVDFGKEIPATVFDGYAQTTLTGAKVLAIVAGEELVDEIIPGVEAIVVLDRTTFYAEMGGQVADHGTLAKSGPEGALFQVTDVQKNKGGKYMHYGKLTEGNLKVGDVVTTGGPGAPGGHHAGPHRHPPAGQGPAHRAGGPCPPGRLPGGARPAAF
ncbi:MAG: alanine--tRNA ligase-related protein, partial [Evtepia sp.]